MPTLEEWERRLEVDLQKKLTIPETERQALVLARRGQGQFRANVLTIERACRVTKVKRPEHLIASHTKPWRDSSNEERLDGENGCLLTPTIDHLFDKGFKMGAHGDHAGAQAQCRRVFRGAAEVPGVSPR